MNLSDRIQKHVQSLPASFQSEVLDFVQYLVSKAEREAARLEDKDFSSLSLSFAMHGMEDEETPLYAPSDLKVVFS
jgi:hypothetical protein